MAEAIKDDRTAQCAASASAIARLQWPAAIPNTAAYTLALDQNLIGNGGTYLNLYTASPGGTLPAIASGRSYPIYVDPFGMAVSPLANVGALGTSPGFKRVDFSPALTSKILNWFTLLDDIDFENNGIPSLGNPAVGANLIQREDRYTWAYLLQQPNILATPPIINMSVVVYGGRSQKPYSATNLDGPAYQATFNPPGVVTLTWDPTTGGQEKPPIRKGGWILDATLNAPGGPHGNFYRVVNVTDTGPTSMDLEIQGNLKGFGAGAPGVVVIMEGVVEVFPRGSL
jgi:hypothetical protein